MIFLGLDPGVGGGIAAIHVDREGMEIINAFAMPVSERDLLDALRPFSPANSLVPVRAVLERVSASPQMGVVSAFTFGKGYGRLLMALTAAMIPFGEVTPATWQTTLSCLSKGDKNVTKRRAQQLFPGLTVTHAIADALLLAEFCRRLEAGGVRRKESHGQTKAERRRAEEPGQSEAAGATAGRPGEARRPAETTAAAESHRRRPY